MTWFVTPPLLRRTFAVPLPGERPGRQGAMRKALYGRTVLITGASSGIGRSTAKRAAAAGCIPLLVARRAEELDALAAEIADGGGEAHAYPADLTADDGVDDLLERLAANGVQVDVLINNAGRSIRRSVKLSTERAHDYERTMALNYHAAVKLILGVLPQMRARGNGHIINVSTMGVQFGAPRFSAYIASKAALDAFSRVLAGELSGTGVAVTTVHMPLVRTPMIEPTDAYDGAPAMSPGQAADWLCEAIRVRPRTVDLPVGPVGELAYTLAPAVMDRVMRRAYRVAGESRAALDTVEKPDTGPPHS